MRRQPARRNSLLRVTRLTTKFFGLAPLRTYLERNPERTQMLPTRCTTRFSKRLHGLNGHYQSRAGSNVASGPVILDPLLSLRAVGSPARMGVKPLCRRRRTTISGRCFLGVGLLLMTRAAMASTMPLSYQNLENT